MNPPSLRGLTWDHPRGYGPMIATADRWHALTGVTIEWDRHSLQGFESVSIAALAPKYDLIVIDHPHVGQIAAERCSEPVEIAAYQSALNEIAANSVGKTCGSYYWAGRQWALPIDAAAQVQAYRPDVLEQPLERWEEIVELAERGRLCLPMRAPHDLLLFCTLCANLGFPCGTSTTELVDPSVGIDTYNLIAGVCKLIDRADFLDPIAALENMCRPDSPIAAIPYCFGYINYAEKGFRHHLLAFADIPSIGSNGPVGSVLGGTGIAVSAFSNQKENAMRYAYWIAGADVQCTLFPTSGGQPANRGAWKDPVGPAPDFYAKTLRTVENAYVRPRHNGYVRFQRVAADRLHQGLWSGEAAHSVISDLNQLFKGSFDS